MSKCQDSINYHSLENNGILRHNEEVGAGENIPVTARGVKDISSRSCIFHSDSFIFRYGSQERVDRIDLP